MENMEKEFKFGYGKIVVATYGIVLELTEIEPPLKIGPVDDEELKKYDANNMVRTAISIPYDDALRLHDELIDLRDNSNTACKRIVVKNRYILDFTEYNKESVNIVLRAVVHIINHNCMILAC